MNVAQIPALWFSKSTLADFVSAAGPVLQQGVADLAGRSQQLMITMQPKHRIKHAHWMTPSNARVVSYSQTVLPDVLPDVPAALWSSDVEHS